MSRFNIKHGGGVQRKTSAAKPTWRLSAKRSRHQQLAREASSACILASMSWLAQSKTLRWMYKLVLKA
jgi:hypothetical protein